MARKGKGSTMAVAERDPMVDTQATDDHDDEDVTSEKAKRERVDLESLDPNERVTLTIAIPAGMKLALAKAGEADSIAASSYARNLLAASIGYYIPSSFLERTRSSKWSSEEERKEAYKVKSKAQRDQVKAILAALKANPDAAASLGVTV